MATTALAAPSPTGFRALMARLQRRFRRFAGTSLEKAEYIMGPYMHRVGPVCRSLGLNAEAFLEANSHLLLVPYTEEELRWAVKSGFVLTLYVYSPLRFFRLGKVTIAEELMRNFSSILGVAPRQARWRLVMRAEERGKEIAVLRHQPHFLRKRLLPAELPLAVNSAVLDFMVYGRLPTEARLTAAVVPDELGNPQFNVLIAKEFRYDKPERPIVLLGKKDSHYPAVVYIKPHNIHHQ